MTLDQFSDKPGAIFTLVTGESIQLADAITRQTKLRTQIVEFSSIASQFIGETEKNIDDVFSNAKRLDAVLFFDEADALFGKRSEVRDSHDRFANMDQSYLLAKIKQHPHSVVFLFRDQLIVDSLVLLRQATYLGFADSKCPE